MTPLASGQRSHHNGIFPAILNARREIFNTGSGIPPFDEAKAAIERLRADHNFFMDQLSQAVKTMRELLPAAEGYELAENHADQLRVIRKRVAAVAVRLSSHNEFEEEQVYGWPALILNPNRSV